MFVMAFCTVQLKYGVYEPGKLVGSLDRLKKSRSKMTGMSEIPIPLRRSLDHGGVE